ncbi:MAG: class I SAM-dependent methyltransferase [Myxococcales bacterium]|nr:class I SAM-dependent methyltransferase [Myxococcales bacterium]
MTLERGPDGPAYPPALYAATHGGVDGDVDFYLRACAGAASVLELGSGTGRVAHALARAGFDVTGLERDRAFIEHATRAWPASAARFVEGDMCDFALGTRFDRVIIPFNGVYCLPDDDAVERCLRCASAHLHRGGLLVFDAYAADAFHADADRTALAAEEEEPVCAVTVDGVGYDVRERTVWAPDEQCIDAFYRYVARPAARRPAPMSAEYRIRHHYLLSQQVAPMLERAGLDLLVLHGGFDESAFDEGSELLVVTATRQVDDGQSWHEVRG